MAPVTRRGFLRTTSIGVASLGLLSAAPSLALADETGGGEPWPSPRAAGPGARALGAAPLVVYISEPATGSGTILVGERAVPFTDRRIVASLQQALG